MGSEITSRRGEIEEDRIDERPIVRIVGDSPFPVELGRLLRDCGCNLSLTTAPDLFVVNIADIQSFDSDCTRTVREMLGKPVVCLMPYPTEREIARVAALDVDLLVFNPLCSEEFKSRIRILLWKQVWARAARSAQEGLETLREALEVAQREMDRERASMAEEIWRRERNLGEQSGLRESAEAQRDREHASRTEAEEKLTALTVENARLEERAKAAEKWAEGLKSQFEGHQEKLTQAVQQTAKPPPARKKSPLGAASSS